MACLVPCGSAWLLHLAGRLDTQHSVWVPRLWHRVKWQRRCCKETLSLAAAALRGRPALDPDTAAFHNTTSLPDVSKHGTDRISHKLSDQPAPSPPSHTQACSQPDVCSPPPPQTPTFLCHNIQVHILFRFLWPRRFLQEAPCTTMMLCCGVVPRRNKCLTALYSPAPVSHSTDAALLEAGALLRAPTAEVTPAWQVCSRVVVVFTCGT